MFHVKDAEFNPAGRSGVYGEYQDWINRPGRFRLPGDGQIDFGSIFGKLVQYAYTGWAVVEWECCIKNSTDGAIEGVKFINKHMIKKGDKAFNDFTGRESDKCFNKKLLGLNK